MSFTDKYEYFYALSTFQSLHFLVLTWVNNVITFAVSAPASRSNLFGVSSPSTDFNNCLDEWEID